MHTEPTSFNIADDRLSGVHAIADFIGYTKRRTQYLIDCGVIPVGREGNRIVASKSVLTDDYRRRTNGAPATA